MKKNTNIFFEVKQNILLGKYGKTGSRFFSIREFCDKFAISFSSAYNIYQKLKKEHLIFLVKQKWFLMYGIALKNSDIRKQSFGNMIGLHVKEINNTYITSIISALQTTLSEQGYKLIIQSSENSIEDEIEILDSFISIGCIGVINFPSIQSSIINYYKNYPLPMVFVGRKIHIEKNHSFPCVLTNNYETGKAVAKNLTQKGYKSFYFVTIQNFSNSLNERLNGFMSELNSISENLFKIDNIFKMNNEDSIIVKNFCKEIVQKASDTHPIALFCQNDLFASKLLNILVQLGADVPNKIGIVGYDDLPICQYTTPTITTVSYSIKQMAIESIKLLLSINKNDLQKNTPIYIPNHIINRKSTARIPNQI